MANTLFDLAQAYLNQGMPNISPIFQPNQPTVGPALPVIPIDGDKDGSGDIIIPTGFTDTDNPNMIRTQRDYVNPFPFNRDDNLGTTDYGYIEQRQPGITGLLKGGADFLKNSLLGRGITGLKNMLPVNRRGILENELLGAGVQLDDIGRVVGDINTPEGIMAGYNAAKITDATFDKRQDRISKTLKDKYGLSEEEIEQALAGTYTGPVQTDLLGRLVTLNQARDLFNKRNKIADTITESRIEKRKEKERQKQIEKINKQGQRDYNPNIHGSTNYGRDDRGQQSYSGDSIGAGNLGFGVGATTGGPVSNRTGRDLKGFTDSRMGITDPDVIEKFANPIGPQSVNVPSTGIGTIDVNLPGNDLMAFAPNSKLDRALKNLYSGYENLGIQNPQMMELMKQDLLENKEKGTPLSLPANAYTLVG